MGKDYKELVEELKDAIRSRDAQTAAEIAGQIDIDQVESRSMLSLIANAYEMNREYAKAKTILEKAYNIKRGRQLAYRLCLLSVKTGEMDDARRYYEGFVDAAPRDNGRYILRYRIEKASGASAEELISILEEYLNIDMDEKWAFELAKLYHFNGMKKKCVEMCDKITTWFPDGKFIGKTLELKKKYADLTPAQKNIEDGNKEEEEVEKKNEFKASAILEKRNIIKNDVDPSKEPEIFEEDDNTDDAKAVSESAQINSDEDYDDEAPKYSADEVTKILLSLQARGVLKADTVSKAVEMIDSDNVSAQPAEEEAPSNEDVQEEYIAEPEVEVADLRGYTGDNDEKGKTVDIKPVIEASIKSASDADNNSYSEKESKSFSNTSKIEPVKPQNSEEETGGTRIFDAEQVRMASAEGMDSEAREHSDLETLKENNLKRIEAEEEAVVPTLDLTDDETVVLEPGADVSLKPVKDSDVDVELITGSEPSDVSNTAAIPNVKEVVEAEETPKTDVSSTAAIPNVMDAVKDEENESEAPLSEAEDAKTPYIEVSESDKAPSEVDQNEEAPKQEEKVNDNADEEAANSEDLEAPKEEAGTPKSEDSKEEKADRNFVLTPGDMKQFEQYLNVEGFDSNIREVVQKLVIDYKADGKSSSGNVVIMGDTNTNKVDLAVAVLKVVNHKRGRKDRKLARIDAGALNRRGFRNSLNKLLGCDLVVENSGRLGPMIVSELLDVVGMYTDNMLIILTGDTDDMSRMMALYPRFGKVFDHVIEVREYNVKDWGRYAQDYAAKQGYTFDSLAVLACHKAIDDFYGENKKISRKDVEDITDMAIRHSNKFGRRISGLFSGKKNDDGNAVLLETDFVNYK